MTTRHGTLYVTLLLVVHCYLRVVDTAVNKHQSWSAVSEAQAQHTDAAGAVTTNGVDRHVTRHNRSSLGSAASLLCDGKRCQGNLNSVSHLWLITGSSRKIFCSSMLHTFLATCRLGKPLINMGVFLPLADESEGVTTRGHCLKLQQEGWLPPTKRASAAKIN